MRTIVFILMVVFMVAVGYMTCIQDEVSNTVNKTVLTDQPNITTEETPDVWGDKCMDCHRNPHDPMNGVPSDEVYPGHVNLECIYCHSDYDHPQLCISCHEGHKIVSYNVLLE